MLVTLENVLEPDLLDNINQMLEQAQFVDGVLSAGDYAKKVKQNQELSTNQKQREYLDQMVIGRLAQNQDFRSAALPHQVSQPVFARYTQGMHYGNHIDDPIMGGTSGRFRVDVALTLFLSEPDSYQGGELCINTTFGETQVKLAAGSAVLYPASSLHRVAPVISGQRSVMVCWIQSLVRDPAKREILFELDQARQKLRQHKDDKNEAAQVDHAYTNLVRMWSEL